MLKGISNFQIEEIIKQINDDDLSNNFVGIFPSDKMTKFKKEDSKKGGKHWLSILDIEPKKGLFFFTHLA